MHLTDRAAPNPFSKSRLILTHIYGCSSKEFNENLNKYLKFKLGFHTALSRIPNSWDCRSPWFLKESQVIWKTANMCTYKRYSHSKRQIIPVSLFLISPLQLFSYIFKYPAINSTSFVLRSTFSLQWAFKTLLRIFLWIKCPETTHLTSAITTTTAYIHLGLWRKTRVSLHFFVA